jgi:hypothetical protein
MATRYHPTPCHLPVTQIMDPMTGSHMIITFSLSSPTFYIAEIRCPLQISTSSSVSGLHLWLSTMVNHPSRMLHTSTTLLTQLLGNVRWESFSLWYNGRPVENAATWMQEEYDIWFQDPCTLVHNLLSNPSFESSFDYTPYQERTVDGVHRFQDFMSEIGLGIRW